MRIASVSLQSSERFPGDKNGLSMKSFRTADASGTEVHYEPSLQMVFILRKGSDVAIALHVSQTEKLELSTADALSLLTEPKRKV